MALRNYISGFLLALLTLFANNGSANGLPLTTSATYTGSKNKETPETVFIATAPHGIVAARRSWTDEGGHGFSCHKKKLGKYTFEYFSQTPYECTQSAVNLVFRRLLEHHPFVQVTSLFPKHGFW